MTDKNNMIILMDSGLLQPVYLRNMDFKHSCCKHSKAKFKKNFTQIKIKDIKNDVQRVNTKHCAK